jgi:hypothetical protein
VGVQQNSQASPTVEESRTLRIEADAICADLAVAIFAFFDTKADATVTIEQSRRLCGKGCAREVLRAVVTTSAAHSRAATPA